ncbi:MAG TPA: GatB/YqeY domain-containing protein [Candidatus Saccharimonadales bacterium]|nr:GatB/YqeY domain-containing protein [Candidatus Saccharimonadales bacterium]
MLKQQFRDELTKSMLARDTEKTAIIRLILSALKYYEIQKGGAGYEATDEDVIAVIQKEVKQRKDSIEQFSAAGRQDLVDKEQKELERLQAYLPAEMPEEEVRTLVAEAIAQTGASSLQDIGKVMGALMPKTKGKADGSLVSKIVKEELSK